MISTFQNWADVADWYAELERDRRVPTPEIRAQADEIARGQRSEEAKAQALYYWDRKISAT
jgi:transglutaminase-like putative cysteine protease